VANRCRTVAKSRPWAMVRMDRPEEEAPSPDIAANVDVRRALARLGHDERLLVVLRYYLDMSLRSLQSAARSGAQTAIASCSAKG
jgi:DNA-directed RNA polymerase specialized sigma24 family protein